MYINSKSGLLKQKPINVLSNINFNSVVKYKYIYNYIDNYRYIYIYQSVPYFP